MITEFFNHFSKAPAESLNVFEASAALNNLSSDDTRAHSVSIMFETDGNEGFIHLHLCRYADSEVVVVLSTNLTRNAQASKYLRWLDLIREYFANFHKVHGEPADVLPADPVQDAGSLAVVDATQQAGTIV